MASVAVQRLKNIRGICFDLSGTLHVENNAVVGAVDAVAELARRGYQLRFVSNTSKTPAHQLHNELRKMGFDIPRSSIFTSLSAAAAYVHHKHASRCAVLFDYDHG